MNKKWVLNSRCCYTCYQKVWRSKGKIFLSGWQVYRLEREKNPELNKILKHLCLKVQADCGIRFCISVVQLMGVQSWKWYNDQPAAQSTLDLTRHRAPIFSYGTRDISEICQTQAQFSPYSSFFWLRPRCYQEGAQSQPTSWLDIIVWYCCKA